MLTFTLALLVKVATTTDYYPVDIPVGLQENIQLNAELRGLSAFYGLSYEKMDKTIMCESKWNVGAYNPFDVTGRAVGVSQYHDDTFYPFARSLGIENPDIFNGYQQIEVMAYMWYMGEQNRWTCTKLV